MTAEPNPPLARIEDAFGRGCEDCDGTGCVCSDDLARVHPGKIRPWSGMSARADACDHGFGGSPCPSCSPRGPVADPPATSMHARLILPYERPPKALTGNTRAHWRRRSADTQQVRSDVMRLAQQAGLHRLTGVRHVTVTLTWAPGDRRRRDADNLWPLLKSACDALAKGRRDWTGLDLVPDDTPVYMEKHAPVILPPPAKGMWLDLVLDFEAVS